MIGQAEQFAGQLGRAADRNAEARAVSEKNDDQPLARLHSIALGQVHISRTNTTRHSRCCSTFWTNRKRWAILPIPVKRCMAWPQFRWPGMSWSAPGHRPPRRLRSCASYPHAPSYSNALLLLARVELARGEGAAALRRCEALLATHSPGSSLPEQQLHANIAFVQATIALLTGDLWMAQRWRAERRSDLEQARIRQEEE